MEMLQGVWKQHLRPRAVVGYGAKISLPSPPNYVTRSPGCNNYMQVTNLANSMLYTLFKSPRVKVLCVLHLLDNVAFTFK